MKIRQVNALKPRVFISKVRKRTSDLWMPPPVPITTKPGLCVGKSLPWMETGTKVDSEPYSQNPEVRASLGKKRFHPAKPDLPILPLKLTCVFKKHKCNNSATFPVYKPPTTLPGMVSGLWTEGEKASGQIDKAVLISYLQILKMEDPKRHLCKQAGWGAWGGTLLCLICYGIIAGVQTHSHMGSFQHKCKRKGWWVEKVILFLVANSKQWLMPCLGSTLAHDWNVERIH